MTVIRFIKTENFFGESAKFEIIWETVCMSCTFAVGIQADKRNELSIFYVTNMGGKDIYTCLDTCFLSVNFNVEEKVKKEMKKVITEVLTARVKAGMITIEQIEKWAMYEIKKGE